MDRKPSPLEVKMRALSKDRLVQIAVRKTEALTIERAAHKETVKVLLGYQRRLYPSAS